jgi:hypothetical protein
MWLGACISILGTSFYNTPASLPCPNAAASHPDAARAAGAVRLSVGMMTTTDEVTRAANGLIEAWRMVAGR